MSVLSKILTFGLAASCMMLASVAVYGQTKTKHKKAIAPKHKEYTLGFQSGRELLFNSSPLIHSRQSKVHYGINRGLVLRKPLNNHFSVEGGLKYTSLLTSNNYTNPGFKFQGPFNISLPVTTQYYFLPCESRCRPFLGAGLQYNFNPSNMLISPFNTEVPVTNNTYQSGTKYISILFTQGMTFEVNTKIEINESFHFIPSNNNRMIGLDMGIGYKIQ